MPLKEELPKPVEELLASQGVRVEDILLSLSSDIDERGHFSPRFLVATREKVFLIAPDAENPSILVSLPLKEYNSFKADIGVGGGIFSALSDGQERRLLRFSTATARKFQIAANALSQLARVGEIPPDIEEERMQRVCPKCGSALDEWTRSCPRCSPKGKTVKRLLSYVKPYTNTVLLISILLIISTVLQLIPPLINRELIDKVLAPSAPLPVPQRLYLLNILILALIAISLLNTLLGIFQQRMYAFVGQKTIHDVRRDLFQHLQFLSLSFYDRRQVGAVMSRVTQDTSALQEFLGWDVPFFVSQFVLLIGIVIITVRMNAVIALLVLIPTPIVAYLTRTMGRRIRSLFHRIWDRWSKLNAVLNSVLSGIRVVKAFAQEDREAQRFGRRVYDLFYSTMRAEQTWATYMPLLFFLFSSVNFLLWFVGGRAVVFGTLTMGTLFAFMQYMMMLVEPMRMITGILNRLTRTLAAADRIFEILDTPPEVFDDESAIPMPRIEGKVEFRNVTFGYDKYMPVLHNISFEVKPGEVIGLVGQSGAGKTTIINLICRFYEVQEGEVLIDGVDVRKIKLKDLRSQIALVPQDAYVFSGSVAENISYGKPHAKPEEIIDAAKAANAHHFIMHFPYGYDTLIGERGVTISGGERQRIAIARAILSDPRILILDEATSLVDTETERQIQEALDRLVKGRTVFAIAHRLSTLRNADRLIVIEDGRIAEMGTHEELLKKKGIYWRLVKLQREMSRLVAIGV